MDSLFTGVDFLYSYKTEAKRVLGKANNLKVKKKQETGFIILSSPS